jgi:subtilisin family serine protease
MAGRLRVAIVAVVALSLGAWTAPASADPVGPLERTGLIESIVDRADPELMEVLVTRVGPDGAPVFETIDVSSKSDARGVVSRLLAAPGVASVEMNQVVEPAKKKKKKKCKGKKKRKKAACLAALAGGAGPVGSPDPLLPQQWAIDSAHLDLATVSAITAGDTRRTRVAIIDSGVEGGHPDLAGRVVGQVDFTGSGLADSCGHGTHVAGIVAAHANNGTGMAGFARTADLLSVKALGSDCSGGVDAVANGIVWAVNSGADVLNLSIEAESDPGGAMQRAVDYAHSHGRVVIAAAGNGNRSCGLILGAPCSYPAQIPGVLAVAATDQSNNAASFSDRGSWVDVAAPGVQILSTFKGSYAAISGTSQAAPHTSALAALIVSHCGRSGASVTDLITRTASHASTRDNATGYGVIQPKVALGCS